MLCVQGNLANTYEKLERDEEALRMRQIVYSGRLEFNGEDNEYTLQAANNYASDLNDLERFEEAKSLLRKLMPVARRVLGNNDETTLKMRWNYAEAIYEDEGATLDDLRESVTTLEDVERISRRVMSGAHPITEGIESALREARAVLRARETPSGSA